MEMDRFGRSTVRNIYFDTDDYVLARHSIAKPDFKEKLRVRSYSKADADSTVFVELKRKFDGVVYKRRVGLREADAMQWMAGTHDPAVMCSLAAESPQVTSEIEYFKSLYSGLKPVLYLSYDREAYRMRSGAHAADGGTEFRITFDSNIRCRESDLTLRSEAYGTAYCCYMEETPEERAHAIAAAGYERHAAARSAGQYINQAGNAAVRWKPASFR